MRVFLCLALLIAACSPGIESEVGTGSLGSRLLVGHDYDPIADAVVSWRLEAGEKVGQSFTLPADAGGLRRIRLKLSRMGAVPPLQYKIGSTWGAADVGSGQIRPDDVPLFFERWLGINFSDPIPLEANRQYYLQLQVLNGGGNGYYEVFGTASAEVEHPNFRRRYQYTPTWGDARPDVAKFENPANIDYGSHTPRYEEGTALAGDGTPIEPVDFAFQLSSHLRRSEEEKQEEERFAFIADELLAPLHREPLPRAGVGEVRADELELTADWVLLIPAAAGTVVQTAAADFQGFLKGVLGVDIAVDRVSDFHSLPSAKVLVVATRHELPEMAKGLDRSESFQVDVTADRVLISGFDERGVMRGLYYLEDLMRLRGAPVLSQLSETRSPLYSPRITVAPIYTTQELELPTDPYTDELLSRVSHYGFNAIWVWASLFDIGHTDVYPELDHGVKDRQGRLRRVVNRAQRYGLDVYVMLAHYPLPASFFESRTEVRGTPFEAHGGDFVLCTSAAQARRAIGEATQDLFAKVPHTAGIVFIIGGEGFIHCHTRRVDCPRCSARSPQEVVAELVQAINEGGRSARPDTHIVLWPYSASNWWSRDDITQSRLIENLQKGVTFLTEFGKEGLITFGNTTIPAYDYPISYVGPSERFVEQTKLTERRAVPIWVKTEHAIALEMVQTPYIPVFFRWAERFRRIGEFPWVSGLFANWMHYGFMPSIAAEVFKWHTWSPLPNTEELLHRIARREFGPGTEAFALKAWREWSEAIRHYPFSGPMAMGPIQKGPAHPLFLDPEYQPLHDHGRQFKNDLSWTRPWGEEVALRQLEKLEEGWRTGVATWEEVVARAAPELKENAVRETGVGKALLACVRSTIHVGRFYQIRDQLQRERNPRRTAKLWDALEEIARKELDNAQQALEVVRRDSRLGYANSGGSSQTGVPRGGIYSPGSIEKKIEQVERLLREDIPARKRTGRMQVGRMK
ncbi:MAG: hypothetical protein GEU99_12675 [Luteitalea sp.]|nr:hypothetical protein [Luteitalea sp.]